MVVALLTSSGNFDRTANINVARTTKDHNMLIASQGQGSGALRADPVDVSRVPPGSAQNVVEARTQKNVAQAAVIEQQPDQQQRAPRTV